MALAPPNSVWFADAVGFLFHAGWCEREELARVVVTRLHENNEAGARTFLQHDCGVEEQELDSVLDITRDWLRGRGT